MYNNQIGMSASTMYSNHVDLEDLSWDQVKLALEQSRKNVRMMDRDMRIQVDLINAQGQKRISIIQAETKVEIAKNLKKEKLETLDEKMRRRKIEKGFRRILQPSRSDIGSDLMALSIVQSKNRGINFQNFHQEAANQHNDRNYDSSRYSLRSVPNHSRPQTPQRR